MKINTKLVTIAFATLCTSISMLNCMEQIEKKLQEIVQHDIKIKFKLPKKEYYFIAHTLQLCTQHDNCLIGEALYLYYPKHPDTIKLDAFKTTKEFRNRGIGEQLFYLTLYAIIKQYPSTKKVVWDIVPFDRPQNSSESDGYQMLFKFYERVGATVDEETHRGLLDLQKKGYLNQNPSQIQYNIMTEYEKEKEAALECPNFFKSMPPIFIAILLTAYFFSSHT